VKPPLAEQLQKYGRFQNFPPGKIALVIRFQVKSLKQEEASNYIISILFVSFQRWVLDFGFILGVFSKNFWAHRFVCLDITPAISGAQNNSKYSRGLLRSSRSTLCQTWQ
jgi:hypothetical protein